MAIQALSESTVRALGSAMAITNPCDLVRELVDNAIDASASFIEVTIAPDTVEKLTVKDNGVGIDPNDFSALGKANHTSKLTTYDSLSEVCGQSLGFRGRALANAVNIGVVTLITKTVNENIAWKIQLAPARGGLQSRKPVSAPPGTTVVVSELFACHPARRHFILKEKKKITQKIQDTLKAYAMARPGVKFALKIHGDNAFSWSYSPCQERSAITQILGSNCAETSFSFHSVSLIKIDLSAEKQPPVISGRLPKPDATRQEGKDRALFVSVDGRPMSKTWHICKKFVNIVKRHAIGSLSLLHVDIQLPTRSYDANVAPLKDEVLIHDEAGLLKFFELVCQKAYSTRGNMETALERCRNKVDSTQTTHQSNQAENSCATTQPTSSNDKSGAVHNLEQSKIKSRMKINYSVNMTQDAKDNVSEHNTVEVEVRPWVQRSDKASFKGKMAKCGSKNILKYFKPVSNGVIEVHADETATDTPRSGSPVQTLVRRPFEPLTEFALNSLSNDDPDIYSEEPERQQSSSPLHAQDLSAASPVAIHPARRTIDTYNMHDAMGEIPASTTHSAYQQAKNTFHRASNGVLLPTPPSSDHRPPRVRQELNYMRPTLPSFQPPRPRARPIMPNSYYGNIACHDASVITSEMGQQEEDSRYDNTHLSSASRVNDLGVKNILFPPIRVFATDDLSPSPRQDTIRRDGSRSPSPLLPPSSHGSAIYGEQPLPTFTLPAVKSMPTSRVWHKASSSSQFAAAAEETRSYVSEERSPTYASTDKPVAENGPVPSRPKSEDSRETLIQRQRSYALHGRQRRLSSRHLPLESIIPGTEVYNLRTAIPQSTTYVRDLMTTESGYEQHAPYGDQRYSMPLTNVHDIERVVKRLRTTITKWVEQQPKGYDVVYRDAFTKQCEAALCDTQQPEVRRLSSLAANRN